jgi:histidinol dehydrogenase
MMEAPASVNASLRFTGALESLSAAERAELFERSISSDSRISDTVREIIARVRAGGDAALLELARELDGVELGSIEVSRKEIDRAPTLLDPALRAALSRSARNIERFHSAGLPQELTVEVEKGVVLTRRPDPLARVGIYAPGGSASYASSVLMAAVPARVAGAGEIILCSPPTSNGLPSRAVLAAASMSGVDRVFSVGGAGAIAAMAIGTRLIPRVDRIAGPGNAYVAEAKLQLTSSVAIDSPAGPSELLVIADEWSDPRTIAREVCAQAEHDTQAVVVVLAVGEPQASRIADAIAVEAKAQPRARIIDEAMRTRGGVLSVPSLRDAVEAANRFAPEHLLIATQNAAEVARSIRSAGSIFIGECSSVAFGDYMTGANHVLPTGGMARCYSGLSTLDFVRWTTLQTVSRGGAASLSSDTAAFARAEGLPAHAKAASAWEERCE